MTVSGGVLREFFFLFGDGFALDELALDGFFLFFEGGTLECSAHHVGFALEACALCRGIEDACGIVGRHALESIGFLSVGVHGLSPCIYSCYENLLDPSGFRPLDDGFGMIIHFHEFTLFGVWGRRFFGGLAAK